MPRPVRTPRAILTASLAGAGLAAVAAPASAQDIETTVEVGFETATMFRGTRFSENVVTGKLDLAQAGDNGVAYGGVLGFLPVEDAGGGVDYNTELRVYGGYAFDAADEFSLDFGATGYLYPDDDITVFQSGRDRVEVYGGASFAAALDPAVYGYYDFELDAFTVEGTAGYDRLLMANTTLDLDGFAGFVAADESDGDDYGYYGVAANVRLKLPRARWEVYGGGRWSGSSEDRVFTDDGDVENNLLYGGFGVTYRR